MSQPSLYNTGGLLPTNGTEWAKIRKPLQKPIATAVAATQFIPSIDEVMKDAVQYIYENRQEFVKKDFLCELNKVFLEITGELTLDHRSDCLYPNLNPESVPAKLITDSNILSTDNGLPLWRIFETKNYKEIRESQSFIARIARQFVDNKKENSGIGYL